MSSRTTTRVLVVDPEEPDPAALAIAAQAVLRGGLVAFATETVYGLGALAPCPRPSRGSSRPRAGPRSTP